MRIGGAWKLGGSVLCVIAAFVAVAALSPNPTTGPCTRIGDVAQLREVPEASGLAVSRRQPGLLWTHNDSGHDTELFAVDSSGVVQGRVRLPVRTRDWEDVSSGSCPSGDCLFIADIGDNDLARKNVQVFRIPEPRPDARQTPRPDTFTLTYPDGPHDAEALFVAESRVFIVAKDRDGELYGSVEPLGTEGKVRLQRIGKLGLEVVTDAETSRDGQSVVVRTPTAAIVYRTADLVRGGSVPSGVQIPIDGLQEPQGEGVALDGDVLYLASEGRPWSRAGRLLSLRCSLPSLPALSAVPSPRGAASAAR